MPINEYDNLLSGAKPVTGNEYDQVIGEVSAAQQTGLRASVAQAAKTTPDRAAEVIKLSERTRLPPNIVERNFDELRAKHAIDGNDYDAILRQTPKLAAWLQQGENAAVASDDMNKMGSLEWLLTAPSRAWTRGNAQVEFGRLNSQAIFRDLTEGEHKRLAELRDIMQAGGDLGAETWFGHATVKGTQQIPMLWGGLVAGAKTGLPAAVGAGSAAALLGQAGPQVLLPEEVLTVPAATALGYYIGSTSGSAAFGFEQEAGHAYEEFSKFRDEMGNGIDPSVAKAAAIAAGGINAGLEAFQLNTLMRTIPGADKLYGAATRQAITTALTQPTVRAALATMMKGYAGTLTRETVTEVAQRAVTILAGELSKTGSDVKGREGTDIAGDLVSEAVDAAQAFTYLSAPGHVARAGQDAVRIREAKKQEAFFAALGQDVSESKTFQRLPEKMREFIETATKDGPIETLYVPVQAWQEYWQSQGQDPAQVAGEVLGERSLYESAVQTGEDIAIPTSSYATRIAPTEHNAFFARELRLAPDEMNAREAVEMEAKLAEEAKVAQQQEEQKQVEDVHAQGVAAVQADVEAKLVAAGIEPATATVYAQSYAAMFRQAGERAGMDPQALYERYGLQINREGVTQDGQTEMAQGKPHPFANVTREQFLGDPKITSNANAADLKPKELTTHAEAAREPFMSGRFEAKINEDGAVVYDGDKIIASYNFGDTLVVDKAYRRQGIGEELAYQWRMRNPQAQPAKERTKASQALQEKVWERIELERGKSMSQTAIPPEARTIEVDGVRRTIYNSNGSLIHPTIEGQLAFWRWFGDSKVVDAQGRPLVVYHSGMFDERENAVPEVGKEGFHFGTKDAAEMRDVGKRVDDEIKSIKVEQSENDDGEMRWYWSTDSADSYDLDPDGFESAEDARAAAEREASDMNFDMADAMPMTAAYIRIENPANSADMKDEWSGRIRKVKNEGHDGIKYINHFEDRGSVSWVVFDPSQIKSATGNRGTFDPLSGNILHQPAYHGSPHLFDRFTTDKIGTGEGAQAYGWGLYFAENPGVAEDYKLRLAGEAPITNFRIAGRDVVRNESYVDYSPRLDRRKVGDFEADAENVWSTLVENLLINEADLRAAASNGEIQKHVLTELDDLIDRYKTEWPEGVKAAEHMRKRVAMKTGVRIEIGDMPGALYEVDIKDEVVAKMLDWELPVADQSPEVRAILESATQGDDAIALAVSANYTGQELYEHISQSKDKASAIAPRVDDDHTERQKAASLHLLDLGIPGIKYSDAGSRSQLPRLQDGEWLVDSPSGISKVFATREEAMVEWRKKADQGTNNLVVFDEKNVKITKINGKAATQSDIDSLYQDADAKRGRIRWGGERQFAIDLLENADLSTFVHESGHFWLEVLGDIVQELRVGDASKLNEKQQRMLADYDTLLKWFGVDDRSKIGVDQHEQFARGIEQYFMEGKAPSAELRSVFARVRAWMLSIYRSLRQLNVTLTPEVREVFDRMFASDAEIEAAQNEAKIAPLFTDAKQAGMSDIEFAAYAKRLESASQRARDELQAKLLRTLQREREQWWKSEREKERKEVEADVHQRREYIALTALQTGKLPDGRDLPGDMGGVKLDRKALAEVYGDDFYKTLPRGVTVAKDGVHPNAAAELFGFGSGEELVKAITGLRPMRQVIDAEADARMREKHGDPLVDGSMLDAARAAVQNEERSKVIEAELRALAKLRRASAPAVAAERAGAAARREEGLDALDRLVPPLASIRAAAQRRIDGTKVRDIKPTTFLTAARRASAQAVESAGAGDFTTAISMKRRELFNVELYRIANKALDEVEKTVDYMHGFGEAAKRGRIAKAGQDYLDQIDGFLDRYEFARVPLKSLEKRKALAAWIAEKERAGEPVDLPDDVVVETRINYKDMTVEELQGVRDSVKQIEHLARLKNRLLTAKQKKELDEVVEEISDSIRANAKGEAKKTIETRLPGESAIRFVDGWFGSHRKIASIARQLDGLKDAGPLWEYVIRPMNEAGDREANMNAAATRELAKVFSVYKGKEMRALYARTRIEAIGASLTKMARLVVALNVGNADNKQKIMDGYGWNESQVQAIIDTLDERDWKFVQGVWDHIGSYWQEIEAKEKRVKGVAPERVQASPVMTRFGEFAGGYYPIKYDDRQSPKASKDIVKDAAAMMMKAGYGRTSTKRGHTKERVEGVKEPIRLDLGVVFEHVTQVIHDITHHEMLIDVNRIVNAKAITSAVIEHYGKGTLDQFTDAIEDVAAGDVLAQKTIERAVNWVRQGVSIAAMGWNLMTSLMQPFGLAQSMVRIGPKWIGRGLSRWMRDAAGMENSAEWVRAKSDFMKQRGNTQMREMNEIRNQVGLSSGKFSGWVDQIVSTVTADKLTKQGIVDSYFWMIAKAQLIADLPTWMGAYEKALAENHPEDRAIALADQAVLDSQGGGQMKDLASIQRGGPMLKLWTNFYSYFNVTYNLTAESVARTKWKDPISIGRMAVDFMLLYTFPATATFLLKNAITGKDDEDGDTILKKLITENLNYMLGSMILLREFGSAISGYAGYQGPAGAGFFAAVGKLIKQSGQEEADAAFWRALNETAGILLHYPAGQVKRTSEGFVALQEGRTRNPLALIVGPPKE